jgi:hypothetical protein
LPRGPPQVRQGSAGAAGFGGSAVGGFAAAGRGGLRVEDGCARSAAVVDSDIVANSTAAATVERRE